MLLASFAFCNSVSFAASVWGTQMEGDRMSDLTVAVVVCG